MYMSHRNVPEVLKNMIVDIRVFFFVSNPFFVTMLMCAAGVSYYGGEGDGIIPLLIVVFVQFF